MIYTQLDDDSLTNGVNGEWKMRDLERWWDKQFCETESSPSRLSWSYKTSRLWDSFVKK